MTTEIIVPGASKSKRRFLVRFENGASMATEAESIGAAAGEALIAVLGCLPPGTDPKNIVKPTIVQLMENVCVTCGKRFGKNEFMEFEPISGNPSVMCLWCVEAVCAKAAKMGGDDAAN